MYFTSFFTFLFAASAVVAAPMHAPAKRALAPHCNPFDPKTSPVDFTKFGPDDYAKLNALPESDQKDLKNHLRNWLLEEREKCKAAKTVSKRSLTKRDGFGDFLSGLVNMILPLGEELLPMAMDILPFALLKRESQPDGEAASSLAALFAKRLGPTKREISGDASANLAALFAKHLGDKVAGRVALTSASGTTDASH